MLFRRTLAALALTRAASAIASPNDDSSRVIVRAADVLSTPYASLVAKSTSPDLVVRQAPASTNPIASAREAALGTNVPLNPDGTLNQTAWDEKIDTACKARLGSMAHASNPSGKCLCYNLASLDVDGGVFAADLRLYRVFEPRDEFVGVDSGALGVSVRYNGASVTSSQQQNQDGSSSGDESRGLSKRLQAADTSGRPTGAPELIKVNMLMGRIDADKMDPNMSMADLEVLLMPIVTISASAADTPTNTAVNTTVSANEASFLVGVFADQVVMSDFSAARAAVDVQMAALSEGEVAFVLPGVQIMVFPIGLIITGVWLLVGVAAYGWGTWERYTYAKTFHMRVAQSEAKARRTF
jgi:hypothetical protein